MASTNHTTNYNLSQYVGSDKPTYLGDYNSDMSKIDTQMKTNADNNTITDGKVGILTNLTTTAQSNVVAAINEVDGNCDTNAGAISTTNTNIGTLSNLNTENKTSIVNAINEIVGKFNFSYKTGLTVTPTNISGTPATVTSDLNSAYNSDGSIGKVYGKIVLTGNGSQGASFTDIVVADTGLRPATDIDIYGVCLQNIVRPAPGRVSTGNLYDYKTLPVTFKLKTDGTIEMKNLPCWDDEERNYIFVATLIFATDFGDTPIIPE